MRQVGDIGRMVDEFSAFARMPKPMMERRDLREVVREAVFLQEVGSPDIRFKLDAPGGAGPGRDRSPPGRPGADQYREERHRGDRGAPAEQRAWAGDDHGSRSCSEDGNAVVEVEDNGKGLPREGPRAAARALYDDAREGDRARPRHRPEDHGGARRRASSCSTRDASRTADAGRWSVCPSRYDRSGGHRRAIRHCLA